MDLTKLRRFVYITKAIAIYLPKRLLQFLKKVKYDTWDSVQPLATEVDQPINQREYSLKIIKIGWNNYIKSFSNESQQAREIKEKINAARQSAQQVVTDGQPVLQAYLAQWVAVYRVSTSEFATGFKNGRNGLVDSVVNPAGNKSTSNLLLSLVPQASVLLDPASTSAASAIAEPQSKPEPPTAGITMLISSPMPPLTPDPPIPAHHPPMQVPGPVPGPSPLSHGVMIPTSSSAASPPNSPLSAPGDKSEILSNDRQLSVPLSSSAPPHS